MGLDLIVYIALISTGIGFLSVSYWRGRDHETGSTAVSKVLKTSTPFMTRNSIVFSVIHLFGWLALSAVWAYMRLPTNAREPLEKMMSRISAETMKVELSSPPEVVPTETNAQRLFTPARDDFSLLGLRMIVGKTGPKEGGYAIIVTPPDFVEKWVGELKTGVPITLAEIATNHPTNTTYVTPEVQPYLVQLLQDTDTLALKFFRNFLVAIYLWISLSALSLLGVASVLTMRSEKTRRVLLAELLANPRFLEVARQHLQKAVLERRSPLTDTILKFWGYFPTYWARPLVGGPPAIVMLDYELSSEEPVEGYLLQFEQKGLFSGMMARPVFIPLAHWNELTAAGSEHRKAA